MPIDNPQYDVAISFLSEDEAIAAALNRKLSEGLRVFFYTQRQEELAGTDGLESMRKPFFDDSRVMVVLYRELWGKTRWTRVEETAIKEACLEYGWERLFFVVLDTASKLPIWLPKNFVRFNYAEFGLEQAVGAIKARVQENGGQYLPLTPAKRAELFEADERFRLDKLRMNSEEGLKIIQERVAELFRLIESHCTDINSKNGYMQIRYGTDFKERNASNICVITNDRVGLTVTWNQPYSNTLSNTSLVIREFNGGLILPSEIGERMYFQNPTLLGTTKYSPDLSPAREYGWKQDDAAEFLSSAVLAERCVIQFVELVSRYQTGEMASRQFV